MTQLAWRSAWVAVAPRPKLRAAFSASTSGSSMTERPVHQGERAVGRGSHGGAVGDDQSGPAASCPLRQEFEEVTFVVGIHFTRWFVGEKDRRLVDQGQSQSSARELAPGEVSGYGVGAGREPDRLERGLDLVIAARAGQCHGNEQVLADGEVVEQVARLQQHANAPGTDTGTL